MPHQANSNSPNNNIHDGTDDRHEFGRALKNTETTLKLGRFAPSPSGPLHFGSLIAAVGSYLIAKTRKANWQVRIEDIDPPREIPGAADTILRQLESFGLHWDGPVIYQSDNLNYFNDILESLKQDNLLYACNCTRKKIQQHSNDGLYPNICHDKQLAFTGQVAWKLRHGNDNYDFYDHIQGQCRFPQNLFKEDFTVKRKDGFIAYQLAVVADDIKADIDHVVRGSDLLDSTPRQLRLYQVLKAKPPLWFHLPVAVNQEGNKLSKQNHAAAINAQQASQQLYQALHFLGQQPPIELQGDSVANLLQWALTYFSLQKIPPKQQIPYFNPQ